MRGSGTRGDHRRTAIVGIAGTVMLASLAGACLASSRATEPVTGNGPLPPPITAGPPPATARSSRSFTVVATGDILPATPVGEQAGAADGDGYGRLDYRRVLGPIAPTISGADLAICHLDRPLAQRAMAIALKELGYDACATASDHALDAGPQGVAGTLDGLDAAGLRHAGTARTAAEATKPTVVDVKGVRVALLSATYGFAGTRPSRQPPWLAERITPGRILTAAHRARRAGARVVVVNLHWGEENQHSATRWQIALAQRLLASKDIDLIVGQHAHVVQPFGRAVNGKLVAYGMGDLVGAPAAGTTDHPGDRTGRHTQGRGPDGRNEGIVARFTFSRVKGSWKVTRAEFIPTYTDTGPPLRVVNVTAALADPRLPAPHRRLLQSVLRRTMRTVGSRGAAPTLAR